MPETTERERCGAEWGHGNVTGLICTRPKGHPPGHAVSELWPDQDPHGWTSDPAPTPSAEPRAFDAAGRSEQCPACASPMLVGKQGAFCPECEPEAGTAPRAQPEGEPEPIIKGIDNIRRHLGLPASPPEPVASTALDVLEAGMMFVATSKTPETKLKNLYATIVNVRSALRNLQVYEEAGPPPLTREQADAVVALVDAGLKGERRLFAMLHGGNRKREDIKRAVAAWQDAVAVPALRSALATLRGEA